MPVLVAVQLTVTLSGQGLSCQQGGGPHFSHQALKVRTCDIQSPRFSYKPVCVFVCVCVRPVYKGDTGLLFM